MSVTASNLAMGPGTLYYGAFGATEPTDAAVNAAPAASAWTDMGGTLNGLQMSINQQYKALDVDQIVDVVGNRLIGREITLTTQLAEVTLQNLATITNSTVGATGANYATWEPQYASTSATQPNYFALILDAWAPGASQFRRRVIMRRVLSTQKVDFAYSKNGQTVFTVTFTCHFVSSSIAPTHVCDQNS